MAGLMTRLTRLLCTAPDFQMPVHLGFCTFNVVIKTYFLKVFLFIIVCRHMYVPKNLVDAKTPRFVMVLWLTA